MITFKELIKKFKKEFFVILLLVIAIISHWTWFHLGNVLSSGDTWFQNSETLREAFLTNTWIGGIGFGTPNIELFKLLFNSLQSFLSISGMQFTDVGRISHFILISILGFLSPYILIKYITKDKSVAFFGAVFYGSTTPFLMRQYLGHLSIAFIIAMAPLVLWLLILSLKKNTMRQWLIFLIIYWIGVCYEPRIMYIVTIILGIYFLFFGLSSIKVYIWKIILIIALFVGLSAFWILLLALGSFSETISDVAERSLFGNIHYSILTSFTLFHDSWTGSQPIPFSLQPIPWFFWLIPIVTVIFFLLKPKKENVKIITFFGVIWLIGIFLTKQVGIPFSDAFQGLREIIPGFMAFRSGSKFWFVLSLGFTGLLSYGLLGFRKEKNYRLKRVGFAVVAVIIIVVSFWNLGPLITGKFGGMFAEREVPSDYVTLKEYVIQQNDYFRTIHVPASPRWSIYTNNHPKLSNINLIQTEWKDFVDIKKNGKKLLIQEQITDVYFKSYSDNLLDVSSIKYVIIPLRDTTNDDDFYIYYGNSTQYYINTMNSLSYLDEIDIGTKELRIYENEEYFDHIYLSSKNLTLEKLDRSTIIDVKYEFINPTKYKITFRQTEPFYLYFSEAYHFNWKLAENFHWYKGFNDKNYVFDDTHFKSYGFLNGWYIDPSKLDRNSSGDYELTIYFKSQSYFYLGLIISVLTLLFCILLIIYSWRQEKNRKRAKK